MKNLIVLAVMAYTFAAQPACDPKELKRLDNYYTSLENYIYIKRLEKGPAIYRGIATTQGQALELAFKDIKEKKCPDKIGK